MSVVELNETVPEPVLAAYGNVSAYLGVDVQRATCAVGDAEIDRTIEIMRKQRATYEDVLNAPENKVAEILDGELFLSPMLAPRDGVVHFGLQAILGRALDEA